MRYEQDRKDLAHHEAEIETHRSLKYALFNTEAESAPTPGSPGGGRLLRGQ
jgi:hypothetical protein